MKKFCKKLVSVLLVLCMMVSMMVFAMPVASSTGVEEFAKKKALELDMRVAFKVATSLADQCENDEAGMLINSVINGLMDAQGNKNNAMCNEILGELQRIETNLTEYTSEISSAIGKLNQEEMRNRFSQKWESDVSGVLKENKLNGVLNSYTQYLIVSTLYADYKANSNGDTSYVPEMYDKIYAYWTSNFETTPLNYKTEDDFLEAQDNLFLAFAKLDGDDNPYDTSTVFDTIYNVVDELTDNFTYEDASADASYTVVECAAAEAYYALPFSHQQYAYVSAQARQQVMIPMLLEMASNEFLTWQGEYIKAYGLENDDISETHQNHLSRYLTMNETTLERTTELFEASIDVNAMAYTGEADFKIKFSDYMKPEDAVAVKFNSTNSDKFKDEYSHWNDSYETEMNHTYAWSDMKSYSNSIKENITFNRVMSGNPENEVYYILDSAQYGNSGNMDMNTMKHRLKREYFTDGDVGDVYVVSCDYHNIIKNMTDGTNIYSLPTKDNINDKLGALLDMPSFGATNEYYLNRYFKDYLPEAVYGNVWSNDSKILTASYNNYLKNGVPTAVKEAGIHIVDTGTQLSNASTIPTEELIIGQDFGSGNSSFLAILANNNEEYKQKAKLSANDVSGNLTSASITYNDGASTIALGSSAALESRQDISVNFTLESGAVFDSLKMIRKNVTETETVLIDGPEELESFLNEDGSYTFFDYTMPYSEVEFIITTTEYPTATVKVLDPAGVVDYFSLTANELTYMDGDSVKVAPGTDVKIKFQISSKADFNGVYAVDAATKKMVKLADSSTLANLTQVGDTYELYTTMPEGDTIFGIASSVSWDDFSPTYLDMNEEGKYIISNYEELRSMAYFVNSGDDMYVNGDFILANDIDCMGLGFESIAGVDNAYNNGTVIFAGTFDGQGYTISNYKIYSANTRNSRYTEVGLFGHVSGEIKNLNLAGTFTASSTGTRDTAGMYGLVYKLYNNAKVSNIRTNLTYGIEVFTGVDNISSIAYSVGDGVVIDRCFIDDTVNFPDLQVVYYGVLASSTMYYTATVTNCANVSDFVAGESSEFYGIMKGGTYSNYIIENCYVYSGVSGIIVTPIASSLAYVDAINCYYNESLLDNVIECGEYAEICTEEQFAGGEIAYLLNSAVTDGTQLWYQNINNGLTSDDYPVFDNNGKNTVYTSKFTDSGFSNSLLNEDGIFEISNADELMSFTDFVNKGNYDTDAILTADIDMTGYYFTPIASTELYISGNPAADGNWGYTGTFDGQGYVISNITIKGSADADASYGLFGTLSGIVKNVGIENFTYTGAGKDSRVGAVAGQLLSDAEIFDCYAKHVNINTQVNTTNGVAGGVAGSNYSGWVTSCYTYDVNLTAGRAGGIVGDNFGDANNADGTDRPGNVIDCYTNAGNICARGNSTGGMVNVPEKLFTNGEITYKLSNSCSNRTWYQDVDNFPALKGSEIYLCTCEGDLFYSTENVSYESHDLDGVRCKNCGNFDVLTLVTEENYETLGLTTDYVGYHAAENASNMYWFVDRAPSSIPTALYS